METANENKATNVGLCHTEGFSVTKQKRTDNYTN